MVMMRFPSRFPSIVRHGLLVSLLVMCGVAFVTADATTTTTKRTKSWTLYHRIASLESSSANRDDNPLADWSVRGTIELSIDPSSDETMALEMSNGADALTETVANAIASSAPNDLYQLKLLQNDSGNGSGSSSSRSEREIFTSVPACNVRRANFRDEILFQLQQGTAHTLSITYMPLISPLAPTTCADYKSLPTAADGLKFDSKVSWETAIPGMTVGRPPRKDAAVVPPGSKQKKPSINMPPPGLKWIPGVASRKKNGSSGSGNGFVPPEDAEKADANSPFGFVRRYWYIFVPLILVNLLSPPAAEEPPPAGATGAAPIAAAAAAGTPQQQQQPVRRRGKKD